MRLIDADIFASELDFADADVCEEFPDSYCEFGFSREKIRELLRDIPTVDTVPVVRCRECRYRFKNNGHDKSGCPIIDANIWMDDDDFCSYGEKRRDKDGTT